MELPCVAKVFYRTLKLIEDFIIFVKPCYQIAWGKTPPKKESKNAKVGRTKNGRIMLFSKCAVYDSKISKLTKEQEASALLSNLGIKRPLSQVP